VSLLDRDPNTNHSWRLGDYFDPDFLSCRSLGTLAFAKSVTSRAFTFENSSSLVSALSQNDPDASVRTRGGFYVAPDDAHRNGAAEFYLAARFAQHSARSSRLLLGIRRVSMVPTSSARCYEFACIVRISDK